MTEENWDLEGEAQPPKKKGIPKWVWIGCGGGCLLTVIAIAVISIVGYRFVKEGMDPEKQWPKLEKVVPFDERPDYKLAFGASVMGAVETYTLIDSERGLQVSLMQFPESSAGELENAFSATPQGTIFGLGETKDAERGELELQERTTRVLRYSGVKGEIGGASPGAGMRIDLSDDLGARMADVRRQHGQEAITDEEVQAFFEPFKVWRER